jgi:hypothetical protein
MSPLTGVLAEAWDLYRRFAGHFLLISFVTYVVTAILVALLSLGGIAGALIGGVLSFAATHVVQASLIKAVQDVRDGRVDLDLSETVRAAGPHILPVIGASILAGIGITIGFILLLLPLWLRSFLNSILSGTLIAPFLALVATLVYYRLTAAHAGEPYTPTGPPGAAVWRPPHPSAGPYGPPPADTGAPGPAPWCPAAPGPARPYPTPGPTEPGPAEPPPAAPPYRGPDAPPPPGNP